jgi:hypothetical protein
MPSKILVGKKKQSPAFSTTILPHFLCNIYIDLLYLFWFQQWIPLQWRQASIFGNLSENLTGTTLAYTVKSLLERLYKAKIFQLKMGWGRGWFLVWFFCQSVEIIFLTIYNLLYITADIHGMRHFAPFSSPTTDIVRWWQHHQTKLPPHG